MAKTIKKTHASKVTGTKEVASVANATKEVSATNTTPAPQVTAASEVTTASPLADRVTRVIELIKMAIALLALNPPALTAAQRIGMAKLRKGGESQIPQIARIAQEWAVQIRTQPTPAMLSALQTAATLQPLQTLLTGLMQEVQDTGFQAESDSWSTASALYTVLKRMSRRDPKLKAQLAPVAQFFAFRRPAPKAGTAKPVVQGKEARKKAKELVQAEALVAEAHPAPEPAPAPSPAAPPANGGTTPHA